MNTSGLTLLIPERADPERDAVAEAWERGGGIVLRLGRFWDPPSLSPECVRVYGNETFCLVLQEKLALTLQTPADDLMLSVPQPFLHRAVEKRTIATTPSVGFPCFVKTLIPKLIPSRVYSSAAELMEACAGLEPETEVFVSEAVVFTAEARAFVLDGRVLDCAVYQGSAPLSHAESTVQDIARAVRGPRAIVVDIGLVDGTWYLVEFNAAWGAGLNGCRPEAVLPAISAASEPGSAAASTATGRHAPAGDRG